MSQKVLVVWDPVTNPRLSILLVVFTSFNNQVKDYNKEVLTKVADFESHGFKDGGDIRKELSGYYMNNDTYLAFQKEMGDIAELPTGLKFIAKVNEMNRNALATFDFFLTGKIIVGNMLTYGPIAGYKKAGKALRMLNPLKKNVDFHTPKEVEAITKMSPYSSPALQDIAGATNDFKTMSANTGNLSKWGALDTPIRYITAPGRAVSRRGRRPAGRRS